MTFSQRWEDAISLSMFIHTISNFQKCRQLLIITRDTERMLEISSKKIEVVPVWKWLLNL